MTDTPVDQDVVDIFTTRSRRSPAPVTADKINADADERRDLADTVISELVRHSVAEEICVYPAMKKYLPDGDKAVDHDVEGHKELEQTMKIPSSSSSASGSDIIAPPGKIITKIVSPTVRFGERLDFRIYAPSAKEAAARRAKAGEADEVSPQA